MILYFFFWRAGQRGAHICFLGDADGGAPFTATGNVLCSASRKEEGQSRRLPAAVISSSNQTPPPTSSRGRHVLSAADGRTRARRNRGSVGNPLLPNHRVWNELSGLTPVCGPRTTTRVRRGSRIATPAAGSRASGRRQSRAAPSRPAGPRTPS